MGHTATHTDRPKFSGLSSPRKTTASLKKPQSAFKAVKMLLGKCYTARGVPQGEPEHGSSDSISFTRRKAKGLRNGQAAKFPTVVNSAITDQQERCSDATRTGDKSKPFDSVKADCETKRLHRQDYEAFRKRQGGYRNKASQAARLRSPPTIGDR